jgi:CRISPR-associated protein Cmr2
MDQSLLKFQIGPVQDFIAQARSTRDLWSGSFLLSWLMAHAVKSVIARQGSDALVFPSVSDQPLLKWLEKPQSEPQIPAALTPNLPNLCVALLPTSEREATDLARHLEEVIRAEWRRIAETCWTSVATGSDFAAKPLAHASQKARFGRQIEQFLSVSWQVTPWTENYADTNRRNAWQLDAVRQTRNFQAWAPGGWTAGVLSNKDSLTGREEAICGGTAWWNACIKGDAELEHFFPGRHAGEFYGAITLVKRLWPRVCKPCGRDAIQALPIPSTWQVANHDPDKNESSQDSQAPAGGAYFAVLAMDGDEMGKWISAEKRELKCEAGEHRAFSARLSEFALKHAARTVREHDGLLIYAGGDDVLALLPADAALQCAKALRDKFREVLKLPGIDASAGIAIAHCMEPLQDVVKAAGAAVHRAKDEHHRRAVAVTLLKRSAGSVEWGCRWDEGGLELHAAFARALREKRLSGKAPYRLVEVVTPYLSQPTPLLVERAAVGDARDFGRDLNEILGRELDIILDRHRAGDVSLPELHGQLRPHLDNYLKHFPEGAISAKLKAIIGLCEIVAFFDKPSFAKGQPA